MRQTARRIPRPVVIALVVALAAALRLIANSLPVTYDEPVYYNVARLYAEAMRAGEWETLPDLDPNYEHPALVKLIYGLVLAPQPPGYEAPVEPAMVAEPGVLARLRDLRLVSEAFGTLNVLAVALASPLAGLLLAMHTTTLRYTSVATLEALPMLTSTVSVLAYIRSRRQPNGWLAVSAVGLGVTAASKYVHALAGIAIALDWLLHLAARPRRRDAQALPPARSLALLLGWGLLAGAAFVAADITLWPAPAQRLGESLALTAARSQSGHVTLYGSSPLTTLVWLFTPAGLVPGIIFTPVDTLVAVLGVVGFARAWREQRVVALWWALGLVFLLVWRARFQHYMLIMSVPMALCAGVGAAVIADWIAARRARQGRPAL